MNTTANNNSCYSLEVQDTYFKSNSGIQVLFTNQYIDFNNYENPIQSYLDNTNWFDLGLNLRVFTDCMIQIATAELSDSIWPWNSPVTTEFATVRNVKLHPCEAVNLAPPNVIATFNIRMDESTMMYSR
jgi:hypothetical protein